jgi:hypothetical protein
VGKSDARERDSRSGTQHEVDFLSASNPYGMHYCYLQAISQRILRALFQSTSPSFTPSIACWHLDPITLNLFCEHHDPISSVHEYIQYRKAVLYAGVSGRVPSSLYIQTPLTFKYHRQLQFSQHHCSCCQQPFEALRHWIFIQALLFPIFSYLLLTYMRFFTNPYFQLAGFSILHA